MIVHWVSQRVCRSCCINTPSRIRVNSSARRVAVYLLKWRTYLPRLQWRGRRRDGPHEGSLFINPPVDPPARVPQGGDERLASPQVGAASAQ